jgi:hypothetical protein
MSLFEFWKSNPWELRILFDGYGEALRDTQEIHAGLTASLMNVTQQGKRPKRFTVYKLIGNRPNSGKYDGESFRVQGDPKKSMERMKRHIISLQNKPKDDNVW